MFTLSVLICSAVGQLLLQCHQAQRGEGSQKCSLLTCFQPGNNTLPQWASHKACEPPHWLLTSILGRE